MVGVTPERCHASLGGSAAPVATHLQRSTAILAAVALVIGSLGRPGREASSFPWSSELARPPRPAETEPSPAM
jgi:hypothetical protein